MKGKIITFDASQQYTYLLDYISSTLHEKISVTQCSKETKPNINEEHNYRYVMCITNVIYTLQVQ